MTSVSLLGLICPVNGTSVDPPPAGLFHFETWRNVTLDVGRRVLSVGMIVAVSDRRRIDLAFDLIGAVGPGDVWQPTFVGDGLPRLRVLRLDQTSEQAVWLDLGGSLGLRGTGAQPLRVRGGQVVVDVEPAWEPPAAAPLRLRAGRDGGIVLDLTRGQATIQADALGLDTICPCRTAGTPGFRALLRRRHRGVEASVALAGPGDEHDLTLKFEAESDLPLPLHAATRSPSVVATDNPVTVPLELISYSLNAVFSPRGAFDTCLAGLQAGPRASGRLALLTGAIGDASDGGDGTADPVAWQVQGTASTIALGLRLANQTHCGTLLLRDGADARFLSTATGRLHALFPDAEFTLPGPARLDIAPIEPGQDDAFADGLIWQETLPILAAEGSPAVVAAIAKSGRGYVETDGVAVETVALAGSNLALPLLERACLAALGQAGTAANYFRRADRLALNGLAYALTPTTHESRRAEKPVTAAAESVMRPVALFLQVAKAAPEAVRPLYADYKARQLFGPFDALATMTDGQQPDYVVLRPGELEVVAPSAWAGLLGTDPQATPFVLRPVLEQPFAPGSGATNVGILKLARTRDIAGILRAESMPIPDGLDPSVGEPAWVGLLLIDLKASTSPTHQLHDLLGDGLLTLPYLAVSATEQGSAERPSFAGRLLWKPAGPGGPRPAGDAAFALTRIDAAWSSGDLQRLDIDGTFSFARFLGLAPGEDATLALKGRYDRRRREVGFRATFDTPVKLLPDTAKGPIRQVIAKSIDLVFVDGKPWARVDGSFELGEIELGGLQFKLDGTQTLDFSGLGLSIPKLGSLADLVVIDIDMPSLRLPIANEAFAWGGFRLSLDGLDFLRGNAFAAWKGLPRWEVGGPDLSVDGLFGIRWSFSIGKLPELALKSVEGLTLELFGGFRPSLDLKSWDFGRFAIAVHALGFEGLELDLLRFLTIRIAKLKLRRETTPPVTAIYAEDVEVRVLSRELVNGLRVLVFNRDAADPGGRGTSGFLAYLPREGAQGGQFAVRWALIGQNIFLDPAGSLARQLIEVQLKGTLDTGVDKIGLALDEAISNGSLYPPAGGQGDPKWLFGAGLVIGRGLLEGRAIVQDGGYVGLSLGGGIFREWFGFDLAFGVAYAKGERPEEDRFLVSLAVPQVNLPAFTFMGGVIDLDVSMNGNFLLDIGFPRLLSNSGRDWNRSLGAIVGILQGSGGFYVARRAQSVGDGNALRLSAGFAVQAGYGASAGGGIFRVWGTIGVYAICEGDILFVDQQVRQLCLSGAVGVLLRAQAELDWWIISVTASVTASAEAATQLAWMDRTYGSGDLPCVAGANPGRLRLRVAFTLYASLSADACIGGGPFRVCKGISVTLAIQISQDLEF